jgi:hypothetical protein
MFLQAENGGIRMAPIGTYFHLQDLPFGLSDDEIAHHLDVHAATVQGGHDDHAREKVRAGRLGYHPYHLWYYDEISIENNISWYAAFRMLHQLTGDPQYHQAMHRIEQCVKSFWDQDRKIFYQGGHFIDGKWLPNKEPFAVDVQSWAITVFGPQWIDEQFGQGTSYAMWQYLRSRSGVFSEDKDLRGFGFTTETDRISIEWTAGAILAARTLARHYRISHPDWAEGFSMDAKTMRKGIEEFRYNVRPGEDAYAYSSMRRWIPFGWFSHRPEVLSLASTAWVYLIDTGVDPFRL